MTTHTTLSTALMFSVLALGCTAVHDITPREDAAATSDAGCRVIEVVAGEEVLSIGSGSQLLHGSWIHLTHRADVATRLHLESAPGSDAGPSAPSAHLPVGGWPSSTYGSLESLPVDRPIDFPLYAPEQDVFLQPTGTVFQVGVCDEVGDAFPTCVYGVRECVFTSSVAVAIDGTGEYACACTPRCETAADCPVPSTGDVVPVCSPTHDCVLPCDASSRCPDGQECVPTPHLDSAALCMTR